MLLNPYELYFANLKPSILQQSAIRTLLLFSMAQVLLTFLCIN